MSLTPQKLPVPGDSFLTYNSTINNSSLVSFWPPILMVSLQWTAADYLHLNFFASSSRYYSLFIYVSVILYFFVKAGASQSHQCLYLYSWGDKVYIDLDWPELFRSLSTAVVVVWHCMGDLPVSVTAGLRSLHYSQNTQPRAAWWPQTDH